MIVPDVIKEAAEVRAIKLEAEYAEHEKQWMWREQQSELLAQIVEEQKRQAKEAKGSKAREIAVIVLTVLSILVTISLAVIPALINISVQ